MVSWPLRWGVCGTEAAPRAALLQCAHAEGAALQCRTRCCFTSRLNIKSQLTALLRLARVAKLLDEASIQPSHGAV